MQFVVDRRRNQGGDGQIQIAVLLLEFDQSALDRLNRFDGFHAATVVASVHYTVVTCQMHAEACRAPLKVNAAYTSTQISRKLPEIEKCELAHIFKEI